LEHAVSRRPIWAALALLGALAGAAAVERAHWLPFVRVRFSHAPVELIDRGAEPRRRLAYDYQRAPRAFYSINQSGVLTVRGPLSHEESYAPPVVARWQADSVVQHFGVTRIDWRLAEAHTLADDKVGEGARHTFDGALAQLLGAHVLTFIGPRGQLQVEAPAPTAAAERRIAEEFVDLLAEQLVVPLPDEPLGRGARWAVQRQRRVALASAVQSRLQYQLDDVDGADGFDVRVALELTGAPQPAAGTREHVVIDQIEGTGTGRIVRMQKEATPVQSGLTYQVGMSVTPLPADAHEPTEQQRAHGYRVALRTRALLKAVDAGPLDWGEDPAEEPLAED
jgi:hypothetical protein